MSSFLPRPFFLPQNPLHFSLSISLKMTISDTFNCTSYHHIFHSTRVLLLFVLFLGWVTRPSEALKTFGFHLYHRFSDPVHGILDSGEKLPEKGSSGYYAALAHRDIAVHGRRLISSSGDSQTPLTFSSGNTTYRISLFGLYSLSLTPQFFYLKYFYFL